MLYNPTNIDFDAQGRLYVAEGVNYRGKSNRRPEGDRIVVLEDTTGSGHADRSTVFVQAPGLAAPLGVAVFENRVVVSQPPDLLVYTDTNRDGKFTADSETRDVLLTGFSGRQHDHSLHSVTAGPDGLWYWNQGNTGAQFTDRSLRTFRMGSPYQKKEIAGLKSDDGHVWVGGFAARMQPDGKQVEIIAHNFRNSYEQAVTSLGDIFQSDNDDPPACRVTPMLDGGNAGFASADGQRSWEADNAPGNPPPSPNGAKKIQARCPLATSTVEAPPRASPSTKMAPSAPHGQASSSLAKLEKMSSSVTSPNQTAPASNSNALTF